MSANGNINGLNASNATTNSLKAKITGQAGDNGTKNVAIMVSLKYLSNFWRTLEMTLISCESNLDVNWSKKCVIMASNIDQEVSFSITDTILYVPVVALSTQDNANLLEQLKFSFKRKINWNKYQSKISTERPNQYLDYLTDASFQRANRRFDLSLENKSRSTSYK